MERDAADRSRYPLAIDQGSSTSINFVESINFSPFQKIRTQRQVRDYIVGAELCRQEVAQAWHMCRSPVRSRR